MNIDNRIEFERKKDLLKRLAISSSTLVDKISAGLWPRPVRITKRAVAYIKDETDQLMQAMVEGQSDDEIKDLVSTLVAARYRH